MRGNGSTVVCTTAPPPPPDADGEEKGVTVFGRGKAGRIIHCPAPGSFSNSGAPELIDDQQSSAFGCFPLCSLPPHALGLTLGRCLPPPRLSLFLASMSLQPVPCCASPRLDGEMRKCTRGFGPLGPPLVLERPTIWG